jgi:hypothetical protein
MRAWRKWPVAAAATHPEKLMDAAAKPSTFDPAGERAQYFSLTDTIDIVL